MNFVGRDAAAEAQAVLPKLLYRGMTVTESMKMV